MDIAGVGDFGGTPLADKALGSGNAGVDLFFVEGGAVGFGAGEVLSESFAVGRELAVGLMSSLPLAEMTESQALSPAAVQTTDRSRTL